jgi:esterase/lipase superfamily enzyme
VNREYHRWLSPSLNRDMELLVFGHAGAKTLIFPTREGRFYDYENWGLVHALVEPIERGLLQLFCVDSIDRESLYCRCVPPASRILRHHQYERYIVDEVIPLMQSEVDNSFLIAHGCSIGAYHAVALALRYPGLFGKVVALSGRYDLTRQFGSFPDLFEGYYDENIYFHMPTHFLPQLTHDASLEAMRKMQVTLAVGEDDPFRSSAEELSRQLSDKCIPNDLAIWRGEAHKPYFWRQMIRWYL